MNNAYEIPTESNEAPWSAGVVIVKKFEKEWKFLSLVTASGKYDITKGIVEPGEKDIEAAIREAYEEAGISLSHSDFIWGDDFISYGRGIAYLAATEQFAKVSPNPVTGIREHEYAKWVSFEIMLENTIKFLKPSIVWAFSKING